MSVAVEVTISVEVDAEDRLWDLATRQYAIESGDSDVPDFLGTRDKPDVGACLIMLLDRSEHLGDAGSIEQTTTDWCWPDEEENDDAQ